MFRILRLRLQIKFWRSLGQLAIWLRDSGQRAYAWYEQHSPMKVITEHSYKNAKGAIPWHEGDEPSEVAIRRMRDGSPNMICVLCKKPIDISTDYFDHDPMGYFHRVCPLPIPPLVTL